MIVRRAFARIYARLLERAPRDLGARYAADMRDLASARVEEAGAGRRAWRAARELADLWLTIRRERASAANGTASGHDRARWRSEMIFAWRALWRRPALAAGVVGTLSIGLAAGVVSFSLLSSVLLRPLPYGAADRLVLLWGVPPPMMAATEVPLHGVRLRSLQRDLRSFDSVEGFKAEVFNLDIGGGNRERLDGLLTTATLFDTIGVRPIVGRAFRAGEDADGAPCAAVLGYGPWVRIFGSDPTVVGRAVRLSDRPCTIVGVAPKGFDFPRGGEMPASFQFATRTEIWVAAPPPSRGPSDLTLLARLRSGVPVTAAQAELDADARHRDDAVKGSRGWNNIRATPLVAQVVPAFAAAAVRAVFGAVTLLMLIAAGNAAQLLVVQGLRQRVELGVRAALGASPARLTREALLGALIATATAVAIGLAAGAAALAAIRSIGPERFPRLSEASLDWRVALFLCAAGAVTAMLAAVGPVWLARRVDINVVLRERSRGSSGPYRRMRSVLVAAQVALSVLLVIGSGLLVRSVIARMQVDPGFAPAGALTFEITLPPQRYPEVLRGPLPASRPELVAAIDAFLAQLRALPGVVGAAAGKPLPMSGAQESSVFAAEGQAPPRSVSEMPVADYVAASDDLFKVLGARMLAGREFTAEDRADTTPVVVVSARLVRERWPSVSDQEALGRRIKLGGTPASPAPWLTIVGVVGDMTRFALDEVPVPVMYVPHRQGPYPPLSTMPFLVRVASGDPAELVRSVREAARRAGLDAPIAHAVPYARMVARVSDDARFATSLMTGFAVMALALSMCGLYGVVAFAVSERRGELGIRTALGAAPGALMRLVIGEGLRPVAAGAGAGMVMALAMSRWLQAMLFHTSPFDPAILLAAPLLLALAALMACLLPARRAGLVDPRETLRS